MFRIVLHTNQSIKNNKIKDNAMKIPSLENTNGLICNVNSYNFAVSNFTVYTFKHLPFCYFAMKTKSFMLNGKDFVFLSLILCIIIIISKDKF